MTSRQIALAALLSSTLALPAAAQSSVDVGKLPIDLERIQRQLRQGAVREERDGLNLRYVVDVYGQAPRIELFAPAPNVLTGPSPYGAPTHRQMIDMITPQEHRAPAADFGSLFRWLADKAKDKK
jgi:hypothetical protein